MANEPVNPHDAFFKQYLSYPHVAADFLRQHLPAELVQLLDLTQLQLQKDSFVDEQLRSHFSDLVYRTVTREQTPVAIALLFEHKSYPDEWVNFQLLRYQVQLWQQEFEQLQSAKVEKTDKRTAKKRTLTPILALLVYHGQDDWKVALRFSRHLTGLADADSPLAQTLARYVPDFEPYFVNLTALSDEALQGEIVTRLFSLVLKHIFEHGLGGHLDEILTLAAAVMSQPSGMGMVVALLRYLGRAGIRVDREEVAQKLVELLPKEGGVLMQTMADEWIEEGKAIGLKEGREEGRKEGLKEGEIQGRTQTRREMILRLLQRRFPPNAALLQQIEHHLAQINDENALNQLVDIALEVIVLSDFVTRVQAFIPSIKPAPEGGA
ncbi:MAG: Rpn family recombination-promoting nuclease/putative transposase [Caldilineaceae bacterium]